MEQKIWDIIAKDVTGEATPEEKKYLKELSLTDTETAEALQDAKRNWDAASSLDVEFDSDKGWEKFLENTGQSGKVRSINIKKGPSFNIRLLKIAAAVTVLIASTLIVYSLLNTGSDTLIVSTSENERIEVLLPDGSTIWLNENSTLEYPKSFDGDERRVALNGEAFFDVAKDADHPFVIETNKTETRVLGTSFNIRSYENTPITEIAVITGKVSFSSVDEKKEVILTAGNSAILYPDNELVKLDSGNSNALSWKTNTLGFNETTIADVINDLEHHFKINIKTENKSLKNCRFTGNFNDPTLEEVLQTLSFTLNIDYTEQQDHILLRGEGCQ